MWLCWIFMSGLGWWPCGEQSKDPLSSSQASFPPFIPKFLDSNPPEESSNFKQFISMYTTPEPHNRGTGLHFLDFIGNFILKNNNENASP